MANDSGRIQLFWQVSSQLEFSLCRYCLNDTSGHFNLFIGAAVYHLRNDNWGCKRMIADPSALRPGLHYTQGILNSQQPDTDEVSVFVIFHLND